MKIAMWVIGVIVVACGYGCRTAHDEVGAHVSEKTINKIDPGGVQETPLRPKERVAEGFLPGSEKIYFVGDRIVAREETDAKPVLLPEATRRLLVGNAEEGDLSLQPALLQRELAEELARSRQLNEQNRALMTQMVAGCANLVAAMEEMKKLNLELARKLEQQTAFSKSLEEQKHPGPEKGRTNKVSEEGTTR